jgi:hypothetical protein
MFKSTYENRDKISVPDVQVIDCNDYTQYKHTLNGLRKLDDNLNYKLNRTDILQKDEKLDCAQIWQDINTVRQARLNLIERCVNASQVALSTYSDPS